MKFGITNGKGFYYGFSNGWGVSVQFGPGNYADNYDMRIGREETDAGANGSETDGVVQCIAAGVRKALEASSNADERIDAIAKILRRAVVLSEQFEGLHATLHNLSLLMNQLQSPDGNPERRTK